MSNHCKIIIRTIIYTHHNKTVYSIYWSSLLINFALALAAAVLLGRCTFLCSFTFGKLSYKLFSLKLLFTFGKNYVLCLVICKAISFWIGLWIILFFSFITHSIAPTRVEFLFRVLIGIGALFRVGTPHSSISLRITFRSSQGETQEHVHGNTCLLRITVSLQMPLFLGSSKCSDWF